MCSSFKDGNGYIDEQELDALLKDLYEKNNKVNLTSDTVTLRQKPGHVTDVLCLTSGRGL